MRMGRWRLVGILLLPAFFLLAEPLRTADCVLEFVIPERTEIALSVPVVDLGEPRRENGRLYYERINAVQVDYRCNIQTDWEVRISAEDFRDGTRTIPITRLQWRTEDGIYRDMPASGSYLVLARKRDHQPRAGVKHSKKISYRLELRGDEWGGTYSAPITYTLFVP
ncbi:hypothetical protein [Capillibacterium thermochitinicola]|uniref:Uncharacterized protein n=1 Tax=Capillibacterium thermochitinicola TaxID=2699427 RepID=A0A8J6I0X3_9FIRM|nr:hypothetical protein [Capillibacterium thermochitinicola]MBA2132654.1 hypothetical protein [Capillibacterium thermochitinicola]